MCVFFQVLTTFIVTFLPFVCSFRRWPHSLLHSGHLCVPSGVDHIHCYILAICVFLQVLTTFIVTFLLFVCFFRPWPHSLLHSCFFVFLHSLWPQLYLWPNYLLLSGTFYILSEWCDCCNFANLKYNINIDIMVHCRFEVSIPYPISLVLLYFILSYEFLTAGWVCFNVII